MKVAPTDVALSGKIRVDFGDGQSAIVTDPHTPLHEIISETHSQDSELPYLGALVNHDVCSLAYPISINCTVTLINFLNRHGSRIYRRTLSFLLAKTVRAVFPKARFSIEHSLGSGYYCSFDRDGVEGLSANELSQIDRALRDLIEQDLPIYRHEVSYSDAVAFLKQRRLDDKLNLLQYKNPPKVTLFRCEDFAESGINVFAPSTGTVPVFRLIPYEPGFVLQFPDWIDGKLALEPFERQPHLFEIFREHKQWGKVINVNTVGDLNTITAHRKEKDLIRISETLHEKKLSHIADRISKHRNRIKWILVAGPSSAGKTTSSKRLMIHLQVNGLRPIRLELDNYFVGRARTPKQENGDFDFEHIDAIDLELLNDHLVRLDRGEEIELPTFNFLEGKPEYLGNTLKLDEDQIVVIEGIHALNPLLTDHLPTTHKFKIYISALTQLKLDNNNRLSTTDLRLIRRMVRDSMLRGHDARATLERWPSVRRGEKRWIFPYQQEADVTFNSSLDYELAVLKSFAEPLLHAVKPLDDVYGEARRLQDFLSLLVSAPAEHVPPQSLLREFIGGSMYADDA